MAKATITDAGEVIIDDPDRPITRFTIVDGDIQIYRYSVSDLAAYYDGDRDTFDEIVAALQDQGFWKRYDDEAGVSAFAIDEYSIFEEQLSEYSIH